MRLLSSDGMIDVPYEKCILKFVPINNNTVSIYADNYEMARYSNVKEATEEMQQIRNFYLGKDRDDIVCDFGDIQFHEQFSGNVVTYYRFYYHMKGSVKFERNQF